MIDFEFQSQKLAKECLVLAKDSDRHSILICGMQGSGKTYLSKYYAELLGIDDFVLVSANVDDIRTNINEAIQSRNRVVVCVENLDRGVKSCAYTILKFLEEPQSNVYVVVTVQNLNAIPDTIVSRSFVVEVHPPMKSDIEKYANQKHTDKISQYSKFSIWECAKSFSDIDMICNMTQDNLKYFDGLKTLFDFKDSISVMSWRLQHYLDNSETPIDLVMQYIVHHSPNIFVQKQAIDCADSLCRGTIAKHIILGRFLMNCKYNLH